MKETMKKLFLCLLTVFMFTSALTPKVVLAEESNVSSVTGVDLGEGAVATRSQYIDQQAVYQDALAEVVEWRQDALDDPSIKFSDDDNGNTVWYTTREYLKKINKTEEEYLNPKWSTKLEKIALQRAVEATSYSLGHTRPNGTGCFSASIGSFSSSWEILAWGSRNIAGAIGQWADEKSDYINRVNGEDTGEIGHYQMLISPYVEYYGFAGANSTWAGEAGYDPYGESNPTNLKGTYDFEVAFSEDKVNLGTIWIGADTVSVDTQEQYSILLVSDSRYSIKGTWTSSNPDVATVDDNGNVTGLSKGLVTLTLTSGGQTFTKDIYVVDGKTMYRVYNPNSGEHFYTESVAEKNFLVNVGWNDEGIGWIAPNSSNTPVYRLYSGTDHHYTTSKAERDYLVKVGWSDEGIGWYSDDNQGLPLYRQFNPNVNPGASYNNSGSHNYTVNKAENDALVRAGWREEGIGWYGVLN